MGLRKFIGQKIWVKKFGSEKVLGQKIVGWTKFLSQKYFWNTKTFGSKYYGSKRFRSKYFSVNKNSGRVNFMEWIDDPPSEKIIGLKLCWVVVSFVRWGRVQNFKSLRPLFLVKVEFLVVVVVWGGVNSNNHVKPNQVEVRLSWG